MADRAEYVVIAILGVAVFVLLGYVTYYNQIHEHAEIMECLKNNVAIECDRYN